MSQSPGTAQERKECPLCGGTVPEGTRKCMFCGNIFMQVVEQAPVREKKNVSSSDKLMTSALAILAAGTILVWGIVARLTVLQSPISKLVILDIVAALAMAVLAFLEASRLEMGSEEKEPSPAVWFLLVLFFWPVAFPWLLKARIRRDREDWSKPGIALAAAFFVSLVIVGGYKHHQGAAIIRANMELTREMEQQGHRESVEPPVPVLTPGAGAAPVATQSATK